MVHFYLYLIIIFRKELLQGANTDLFNPLVPKAYSSECQYLVFPPTQLSH